MHAQVLLVPAGGPGWRWGCCRSPTWIVSPSWTMRATIVADLLGDLVGHRVLIFEERLVVGDDEIHVLDIDEGVAEDARHPRVHLGDDEGGVLGGGLHDVHADAQAHEPVLVGQRGLDQGHVDGHQLFLEQAGHLGEEDGRVIGQALVHRLAGVVADKKGIVPEVVLELCVRVGRHAQGPDLEQFGIEKGLGVGLHIIDERT